jgi:hypothetical protein
VIRYRKPSYREPVEIGLREVAEFTGLPAERIRHGISAQRIAKWPSERSDLEARHACFLLCYGRDRVKDLLSSGELSAQLVLGPEGYRRWHVSLVDVILFARRRAERLAS